MALFMIFATEAHAKYVAESVTAAMGLPTAPENVTQYWNHVRQRQTDNKFTLLWPGDNALIPPDAPPFTIEEYNLAWYSDSL